MWLRGLKTHFATVCLADQFLCFWGRVKAPLHTSSKAFQSHHWVYVYVCSVVLHFSTLSQFGTLLILHYFPVP